jgi:uncharacterized protein YbbC (DUF1343 family)
MKFCIMKSKNFCFQISKPAAAVVAGSAFLLVLLPGIGSTPDAAHAQSQSEPVTATVREPIAVTPVLSGLDVLRESNFEILRGQRVGLITNQTGITREGGSGIDVLAAAPGVRLVALFAPEHGVRGNVAAGKTVKNSRDAQTGVPIYSLYGGSKKPSAAMLKNLDTLVFDLQDIGSRSYTYISTMKACMESAAKYNKRFVVLDRPNLIGGHRVEGNILNPSFRSFVGPAPIAYCHGMTTGELAWMMNGRGWLAGKRACRLNVVTMKNYRRALEFPQMQLPWVATSPNIPQPHSAYFYAATGIVGELSALSIGIGTSVPFQLAGAPGIKPEALKKELDRRRLPGVAFKALRWKPSKGAFRGQTCGGVQIILSDKSRAQLTRLNFEIMDAVRRLKPQTKFFGRSRSQDKMFDLVCGTDSVRRMFSNGKSGAQIWASWNAGAKTFKSQRQKYLLYK